MGAQLKKRTPRLTASGSPASFEGRARHYDFIISAKQPFLHDGCLRKVLLPSAVPEPHNPPLRKSLPKRPSSLGAQHKSRAPPAPLCRVGMTAARPRADSSYLRLYSSYLEPRANASLSSSDCDDYETALTPSVYLSDQISDIALNPPWHPQYPMPSNSPTGRPKTYHPSVLPLPISTHSNTAPASPHTPR